MTGKRTAGAVTAAIIAAGVLAGCAGGTTAVRTGPPGGSTAAPVTSLIPETTPVLGGSVPTTTIVKSAPPGGPSVTSPPGARATTVPSNPITRAPSQGVIQLTTSDDNSTFAVVRGQVVELKLADESVVWGPLQESPQGLLRGDPSPAPSAHGQLAVWTAVHAGTVRVTATGTAYCTVGMACPAWARLFAVTLVIS